MLQEQTYLSLRVVRSHKVWSVFLLETLAATLRKVFVVMEDATSGVGCQVNSALVTQVGQIEHAQHIDPNDLQLHAAQESWGLEIRLCCASNTKVRVSPCDLHTSQHWGVQSGQRH